MKKFNYKNVKKEINGLLKLEQILIDDGRIQDLIRILAIKRKKAYERIYDIIKNNIIEAEEEFYKRKYEDDKNYKKLYYDLLMEVVNKDPNETRHETAKRCIRERENSNHEGASKNENKKY